MLFVHIEVFEGQYVEVDLEGSVQGFHVEMEGDLVEIFQDGCLCIFFYEFIVLVYVLAQFGKVEAGADVVAEFEGHLVVLGVY